MFPVGASRVRNHDGVVSVDPMDYYTPDPRGLGCALFDRMVEYKNLTAQIDGITGEEETYESLLQRCVRTAITMSTRGLTSEDLITICSYNNFNCCVPYIASLFLGTKISPLDPELCLTDSVLLLSQVRPKMIFVGPEAVKLIEDAVRESGIETHIVVFDNTSTTYEHFEEFLKPSVDEDNFLPVPVRDLLSTALIAFSAGTTGLPKGVCMSHRALLLLVNAISAPHDNPATPLLTSQLMFASLYWISTATLVLICIFFRRARIVYPKFQIDDFWSLIQRTKVHVIVMSPNHVQGICIKVKPKGVNISNLKQVFITGGPISKEQILDFKTLLPGVQVINLYGSSEAGGYTMSFRPHVYPEEARLLNEKPDSCGRPRRGISCRVVDNETGEVLGPYQKGELRIQTEFQMTGYYSGDSSNRWDADGWLKSGDVAYYDEENCFFIVDRMKEMLKFRSWYVAPAKLEGILHSHPAVATAVVVGLTHPEDGHHPVGVVVLRPSAIGAVTAEDIENYVEQRVADRYRLRGGVRIVNHIPVTPTGKTRRRDMREMVLRGDI